MIRRLRIRLTLVAAASLLGVLLLIMGTVNTLNYWQILREADQILNILKENQGKFPQREPEKGEWAPGRMSPELPFESRYFSVFLCRHIITARISQTLSRTRHTVNRNVQISFIKCPFIKCHLIRYITSTTRNKTKHAKYIHIPIRLCFAKSDLPASRVFGRLFRLFPYIFLLSGIS
jgi:hypothetical protein